MSADKENEKMQQLTIKLKIEHLNRLKKFADKTGNPVSHYIREAVLEYLENHEIE
jgi:predicted DNA-binding protein